MLGLPTIFIVAHILIWFSRREVQMQDTVWTGPLSFCALYASIIVIPVSIWFFHEYPAWSISYFRNEEEITLWGWPLLVSVYFTEMMIVAIHAQSLLQLRKIKEFWMSLLVGFFWFFVTWKATREEFVHLGTYNEFKNGVSRIIFEDASFMNRLYLAALILTLPIFWLAFNLWTRSRKYRWLRP